MKITQNTDTIRPGKRYFLELTADEEPGYFALEPYGRLKLPPSHARRLYSVVPAVPAFQRCKDCVHAEQGSARNVSCKYNPKSTWSKMSKACEKFEGRKETHE